MVFYINIPSLDKISNSSSAGGDVAENRYISGLLGSSGPGETKNGDIVEFFHFLVSLVYLRRRSAKKSSGLLRRWPNGSLSYWVIG